VKTNKTDANHFGVIRKYCEISPADNFIYIGAPESWIVLISSWPPMVDLSMWTHFVTIDLFLLAICILCFLFSHYCSLRQCELRNFLQRFYYGCRVLRSQLLKWSGVFIYRVITALFCKFVSSRCRSFYFDA